MFKKIVIVIIIILALLSIYFGSYLPVIKSQAYIGALQNLGKIRSIQDFKNNFDKALNFYSPIGQEEIVKFLSNDLGGQFRPEQKEEVLRLLTNYIEPYIFQNNVRHLLATARMYEAMWQYYKHEEDWQKAEQYYLKAYQIGPKLPPVLFGMANLYKNKGDLEKTKQIAIIIIGYWPNAFEPVVKEQTIQESTKH